MDKMLTAALVCGCLLCAGTAVFTFLRLPRGENPRVCVRETGATILLGAMLCALGIAVCILKLRDPTVSGTEESSYLYLSGASLLCELLGCYAVLFGAVKRILAYDDRVEYVSPFGTRKVIPWTEVVRCDKAVVGRTVKLISADKTVITVSGEPKQCEKLLEFTKNKTRKLSGRELLRQAEARIR